MVMGNALWELIKQSDRISQLVLLILLFLSIACWTVFIYKYVTIRIKNRQVDDLLAKMNRGTTVEELLTLGRISSDTQPGYFLHTIVTYIKNLVTTRGSMPATQAGELVNQQIDQSLDELVHEEESYLPLVSTSAGVSTLLGLFGTIWGLIHAFIRISQMQSADIATVAPGIAEALITTLAGLMVAIPSTVMYNVLVVQVRKLEHKYLMLADKITMLFEPLFKN